jgi:hypothetical protein
MITGFNHNIKYKNRIYHIQTEDSGTKNPHIITHLFVGGNIIATRKSDYAQLMAQTAADKLPDVVRNSMEEQHKAMLRSLIHGKFDNALNAAGAHHLDGPAPLNVDADVLARTGGSGNKGSAPVVPPRAAVPPPAQAPAPVLLTTPKVPAPPRPVAPPPDLAAAALAALAAGRTNTPRSSPAPVPMPPDVAPEVLAAMQLREKPQEKPVTGDTIFGEDLISEKSLDEVILSYLSEELE